jgi:hypothetical protein
MKHSIALALLALLVSVTVAAGASLPPGPFSTTGYTTNFEVAVLPSGYAQFRIQARGGPAFQYEDALLCQSYGAPSCDALCQFATLQSCGVNGSFEGSFSFDEVGIGNPLTSTGANEGLMTITTDSGAAEVYFGGLADDTAGSVDGGFQFLGGSGDYRRLRGIGTYQGSAAAVFKVDYEPCGQPGQLACPATLCAARGEDLKLLRPKAMWTLGNYGNQTVRLDRLLLHWPEQNGALTGVRLGGKLLATGSLGGPPIDGYYWVDLNLSNAPARDREIRGGKSSKLMLDFENMGIGQAPADYTFLAEFAEGCAAIHVAFP